MDFVLIGNWNYKSFKTRFYKSYSGISRYCKAHNILFTEVTELKDINYLLRSRKIDYVNVDRLFVAW